MEVGVTEVDRQHRKLLDLFNDLEDALARRVTARMIRPLFAELASYAHYHFRTEQNLMRVHGFSGHDEHAAVHDEFIAKVSELQRVLGSEGSERAALDSSRFLRAWIVRHILVADKLAWAVMKGVNAGLPA